MFVSKVQRFGVQRFRGSRVKGLRVQRFKGPEVQGFIVFMVFNL